MAYRIPSSPIDTEIFPKSYGLARQAWLERIGNLSLTEEHAFFPCQGGGPDGELLLTDTVCIGASTAPNMLVIIGATHGVEGFAGSAVQFDVLELLTRHALILPDDTSILLIHALNPWGYAWLRRCDQEGVDLNRNFIDFTGLPPENRGYQELRSALFVQDRTARQRELDQWLHLQGRTNFEVAVSGGQYRDPAGPFYGGTSPAHGRLVIEKIIEKFNLSEKNLAVIDVHTGLGQFGYGEIICDHLPGSPGAKIAQQWFGLSVMLPLLGTSMSVPKTGLLDYAWHAFMNSQSCYVTLEFGTFSTGRLFDVLLDDHRIWAKLDPVLAHAEHGSAMLGHFNPDDRGWREMVLFRARQVIAQALSGVSN
jgi:hypothetical protein